MHSMPLADTEYMPPRRSESLFHRYRTRWDVTALWCTSAGLLVAGLSLPVMRTKKLLFWDDSYSILQGVNALSEADHIVLALILFVFSIVFPIAKLGILAFLWFVPFDEDRRQRVLHWTSTLGKWSMLDVFVVAIIIVVSQLGGLVEASARIGVYVFAAAIVGSIVTSMLIERLAKKN
jgi:paraquat-inducible protein A